MFSKINAIKGVEQISPETVNLSATSASAEVVLTPSAMTMPIKGTEYSITISLVNGATAITSGTVGDFINEFKIMQGSKTLLNISNISQLEAFFHIKNGTTLSDVNLPTTASATDSATLQFKLPFRIALGAQVSFKFKFNGYNNAISGGSVTNGTATVSMAVYYSNSQATTSEAWEILPTPVSLGADVDINLGSYLGNQKPIFELWTQVSADSGLNYYKFEIGKETIFDVYPVDMENLELVDPQYSHVSGLFYLPIVEGAIINTGSNSQSKAIINLASSQVVTSYVMVG